MRPHQGHVSFFFLNESLRYTDALAMEFAINRLPG
jgi:hypothetical protein